MTAAAIALLPLFLPGKEQSSRAGRCGAALMLLTGCDNNTPANLKAKPDRGALTAGGAAFVVRLEPVEGKAIHAADLDQAADVIQKRLNPEGTRAVIITEMGDSKLMVEVAGLTAAEAESAKSLLQKSARLEFRLLGPDGREETTKDDTAIKPGFVKLPYLDDDKTPGSTGGAGKYLWVKNKAELTGKSVEYAGAQIPQGAYCQISVELHEKYGDKMLEISKANIGKPMAIIVDGEVISAPTIQGEFGKSFQITGSFTEAEAIALSNQLMNPLENPLIVEKITAIPPAAGE